MIALKSWVLTRAYKFEEYKILSNEVILFFSHIYNDLVWFGFALTHPKPKPNLFDFGSVYLFRGFFCSVFNNTVGSVQFDRLIFGFVTTPLIKRHQR